MIVSIHQPQYLPWLGYFDKIDRADVFILLDDVQYKKNEWQNRNKIRNNKSWQWLTVPVNYRFGQSIKEVQIDSSKDWAKDHYESLVTNYSKTTYFKDYEPFFKESYQRSWKHLAELNSYFIEYFIKLLGITTKIMRQSEVETDAKKTDRLVEICQKLGADTYLSGQGAKDYLEIKKFKAKNIKVVFQAFKHPVYNQAHGGFEPFMSIADLLFNYGKESLKILRGG